MLSSRHVSLFISVSMATGEGRAGIDVWPRRGARGRGYGRTEGSRACGLEGAYKVAQAPDSFEVLQAA